MVSSYTSNLRLVEPAAGDLSNTWGTTINSGLTALVDQAVAGVTSISMSDADYTMSYTNGASDEARSAMLIITSVTSLTATRQIIAPAGVSKLYVVYNNTTGGQSISIGMSSGTTAIVPNGKRMLVYIDGTNCYEAVEYINSASLGSLSLSGGLTGTTGTFSGTVTINSEPALNISGSSGAYSHLYFQTSGVGRWSVTRSSASETGSNAGSDLQISRFSDSGAYIDTPLNITRSTGLVAINDGLVVTGGITGALTGNVSGNASTATALASGGTISITGDISYTSPTFTGSSVSGTGTLATVNSNVGSFGSGSSIPNFTVNAKGLITAAGSTALSNATTSSTGVVALATAAQVIAGADSTHAVTPASLTSQQSLTANGYITLPGGLILQWGQTGTVTGGTPYTVSFPTNFPNNTWSVTITAISNSGSPPGAPHDYVSSISVGGFTINDKTSGTCTYYWKAIGN